MAQFIVDNIDQLDLALDQLAVGDRNFDRFALMLIDNVVELTLHKFAQDRASENKMWSRPFNDPKTVKKALSQNFSEKVKAAYKFGLFDETMRDSILNLHQFRNTAYHQGLRHEGILRSLALFYFECCCEVLMSYEPRGFSWSSSIKIPYRVKKYIGNPSFVDQREAINQIYTRLSSIASSMGSSYIGIPLITDLAKDLRFTIEDIDSAIDFIANERPEKKTRDEAIIDVQVWSFAFTDEAKKFARDNGCPEADFGFDYIEWITKNYKWPINSDPIRGWWSRHKAIETEQDRHMALKKYCNFLKQTEDIRSKISEAALQLEIHIDQMFEMSRGN